MSAFAFHVPRPLNLCIAFVAMAVLVPTTTQADTLVQFLITTATTGSIVMPGSVTTVTGLSSTLMSGSGGTTTTGNTTSPAGTWNRTYPNTQATGTGSLAAGNWITWTTTAATGDAYLHDGRRSQEGRALSRSGCGRPAPGRCAGTGSTDPN